MNWKCSYSLYGEGGETNSWPRKLGLTPCLENLLKTSNLARTSMMNSRNSADQNTWGPLTSIHCFHTYTAFNMLGSVKFTWSLNYNPCPSNSPITSHLWAIGSWIHNYSSTGCLSLVEAFRGTGLSTWTSVEKPLESYVPKILVVATSGKERAGKDLGGFDLYSELEFVSQRTWAKERLQLGEWLLQKYSYNSWNGYILQNIMVGQVISLGQSRHLLVMERMVTGQLLTTKKNIQLWRIK